MFTGSFDIEVEGKKRSLKFGTLSFALFCEAEGIELNMMGERFSNPKPFTQINLIHSAAVAHCRLTKQDVDFSMDDVTLWIDEVTEEVISEMLTQAIKTYTEKKTTAGKKVKAGKRGKNLQPSL